MSVMVNYEPLIQLIALHGEEKVATSATTYINMQTKRRKFATDEERKAAAKAKREQNARLRKVLTEKIKKGEINVKDWEKQAEVLAAGAAAKKAAAAAVAAVAAAAAAPAPTPVAA